MFLFGTAKLSNLLNSPAYEPTSLPVHQLTLYSAHGSRRKAQGVFVLLTAHGTRCVFAWWRFAFNHKLSTINY